MSGTHKLSSLGMKILTKMGEEIKLAVMDANSTTPTRNAAGAMWEA